MRCEDCNKYLEAVILKKDIVAVCWDCWKEIIKARVIKRISE